MSGGGDPNEEKSLRGGLLKILRGDGDARPVFQPRLEHWWRVRLLEGDLPARFRGLSLIEVHRELGCAIRPYHLFNRCLQFEYDSSVQFRTRLEGNLAAEWRPALGEAEDLLAAMIGSEGVRARSTWTTPAGKVESVELRKGHSRKTVKYPVTSPADARVFRYVLDAQRPVWNQPFCDQGDQELVPWASPP